MLLQYPNKKDRHTIFENIPDVELLPIKESQSSNLLIKANNLVALKQLITKHQLNGKIDLVYL
ncbi:MAG TPA: hypothetical protein PKD85_23795, partial [Saprospiraceae bacterium]|nr:hypothetical protein [Saprospiraceae bacterium]